MNRAQSAGPVGTPSRAAVASRCAASSATDHGAPSWTTNRRDAFGQVSVRNRVRRAPRSSRAGATRRRSDVVTATQDVRVPVGDLLEQDEPDPCGELGEPLPCERERVGQLLRLVEADAALAHQLTVRPASHVDGREPARQPFEQRVRAGLVAAGREEDVVGAEHVRDRAGVARGQHADPAQLDVGLAADVRQLDPLLVEVAIEPGERLGPLGRVRRPARRDDAQRTPRKRLAGGRRRVEDQWIGGVRDDDRCDEVDALGRVLLEAVARLEDRRVGDLRVDALDPPVAAVVEAAIRADRPVDAVDHPHALAMEAAQAAEVEVERVEQAHGCSPRDAVPLDREPARLELAHEPPQELVATSGRWWRVVVEHGQVGGAGAARTDVQLGPHHGPDPAADRARVHGRRPRLRSQTHGRRTVKHPPGPGTLAPCTAGRRSLRGA